MSFEVDLLKRIRINEEANGSFATDVTVSDIGSFLDLPFNEGSESLVLDRPTQSPLENAQYQFEHVTEVLLPKRASLSFTMNLDALSTRADDGVAASQGALGMLLKIGMGGEQLGTGDTVSDAGPATTDFDVTTVARFDETDAIGIVVSSGVIECREIATIASSNLLFKVPTSAAPSNGAEVYQSAKYWISEAVETSLQCIVEGKESDDNWVLYGGQLDSMSFNLESGTIPTVSFTWKFADWKHGDEAAYTPSALAFASFADRTTIPIVNSQLLCNDVATRTISEVIANSITFEPNIEYVPISTPSDTNNIYQWKRTRSAGTPAITGSFTLPFEDHTRFHDDRNSKTRQAIFFQIGNSTTDGAILISVPSAQILNHQRISLDGQIAGEQITFAGGRDTDNNSSTGDDQYAPFRIHLF